MNYYLHVTQGDDDAQGCENPIGCGGTLIELESTTPEALKAEIRQVFDYNRWSSHKTGTLHFALLVEPVAGLLPFTVESLYESYSLELEKVEKELELVKKEQRIRLLRGELARLEAKS